MDDKEQFTLYKVGEITWLVMENLAHKELKMGSNKLNTAHVGAAKHSLHDNWPSHEPQWSGKCRFCINI